MSITFDDLVQDAAEFAVYAALGYLQDWLEGDVGSGSDHHYHHQDTHHDHPVHNPPTTQPHS
ncbi:MAG TPA: hypothetical protein VFE47_20160 [Tepidisphaeraceae bacterium]|jgi:hypothetical protein|nr:hypothetical protein [Tepidisphaeraceae bacterium]